MWYRRTRAIAIRVDELPPCACDNIIVPSPEVGNRVSMGAPTRHGSPPPRSSRPKKRYSAPESIGRSTTSPQDAQTKCTSNTQSSRSIPHLLHAVISATGLASFSINLSYEVSVERLMPGNNDCMLLYLWPNNRVNFYIGVAHFMNFKNFRVGS